MMTSGITLALTGLTTKITIRALRALLVADLSCPTIFASTRAIDMVTDCIILTQAIAATLQAKRASWTFL